MFSQPNSRLFDTIQHTRARCIAVSNHGFQYTPLQVGKTGDISGHGHRRRTPANGPCGAIPPTRRLYAWQRALRLLEDEAVRRAYQGTLRPQAMGGGKVILVSEFSDQLLMFLLKCRNRKVFGDRREDTVHLDGQPSIADILRSRRQERLAREATEEAAAKAAAIRVDRQPLELESDSEEKQEG